MSAHCRTDILWRSIIPQKIYPPAFALERRCRSSNLLHSARRLKIAKTSGWHEYCLVLFSCIYQCIQHSLERFRPSAGANARRAFCGFLDAGDRATPRRPGALAAAFSPRITRRRRSISGRGSPARRASGGARSLRPESSGGPGKLAAALSMPASERRGRGPARSSRLSRRWRLSAGAEARRPPGPRCCFLGAGNRPVRRRRDALAAAF
jgi:hypothetical protein